MDPTVSLVVATFFFSLAWMVREFLWSRAHIKEIELEAIVENHDVWIALGELHEAVEALSPETLH